MQPSHSAHALEALLGVIQCVRMVNEVYLVTGACDDFTYAIKYLKAGGKGCLSYFC